jgi:hypothetical protein
MAYSDRVFHLLPQTIHSGTVFSSWSCGLQLSIALLALCTFVGWVKLQKKKRK